MSGSETQGFARLEPLVSGGAFLFEGQPIPFAAGEPVIVALMASGVRVLRTMPLSGEPRGGFCLVGRCSDCLVEIDGQPGVRACITLAEDGMTVARQQGVGHWLQPVAGK